MSITPRARGALPARSSPGQTDYSTSTSTRMARPSPVFNPSTIASATPMATRSGYHSRTPWVPIPRPATPARARHAHPPRSRGYPTSSPKVTIARSPFKKDNPPESPPAPASLASSSSLRRPPLRHRASTTTSANTKDKLGRSRSMPRRTSWSGEILSIASRKRRAAPSMVGALRWMASRSISARQLKATRTSSTMAIRSNAICSGAN